MARKAFTSNFSKLFHRAFLMFILAVFIGSSAVALLPIFRVDAATASNFSMFTGVTPAQKKSVAEAWNKGGGDEYDKPGWSVMRVYIKDIAGIGAPPSKVLEFNEKLTKEMACERSAGAIYSCESREPLFTTTYYCTVAGNKKTYTKPAGNEEYYEIVYAVGLKNNGNNGDDFVKRKDYNATGGPLLVKKFEMQDGGYLNDGTVTRDLTTDNNNPGQLGDKREGNKNGRNDNDWGIDDQDDGCRPGSGTTGNMKIKSFATLSSAEKAAFDPEKTSETITAGADTDGLEQAEVCKDMGPLGWIVCPLVEATVGTIKALDGMINQLLTIDTDPIFNTKTQSGENYKKSWSIFRSIALGIVIIAVLIIIISTAFGYEILDAYTLRKLLPRILISIIFITLSWNILEFLITLTNDVGNGVRALIYMPFQGNDIEFGATIGVSSWLLLGGGVAYLTAAGVLSLAVTALLAVLIAFLVLVLRELIIVVLVLSAPIGIACLILPNTRKGWQIWQNTLTVMLVVFPIISAIIATGRVFAITVSTGPEGKDIINQLIAFTAYLLPYFMLPFAFRMAGGAMATLAGLANDRSRGAFDRLKNYRGNKGQESLAKMKSGNRWNEDHVAAPLTKRLNKFTSGAANIGAAGYNPRRMRSRMQAALSTQALHEAQENSEKNESLKAVLGNDDYLNAVNASTNPYGNPHKDDGVRKYLERQGYTGQSLEQGVAAVREARRSMSAEAFEVATTMANPSTGTAYKGGGGEMLAAINEVAGDDRHMANRMLAQMRSGAERARRPDLIGGGFGAQSKLMEEMHNGTRTAEEVSAILAQEAITKQEHGVVTGAKAHAVKNLAPAMLTQLQNAYASGNEVTIKRTLASIAGKYDNMSRNSAENAEILADAVLAQPIGNGPSPDLTVQQLIENARQDPEFLNMRREYGRGDPNDPRMGGGGPGGAPGGGAPE